MEADWEVEIGADAPVIEARGEGFVDLVAHPDRIGAISEVHAQPVLGEVLVRLNARHDGQMWTSKCDAWRPDAMDPDELDAAEGESTHVLACYIDLLARDEAQWNSVENAITWAKAMRQRLRNIPLRCARIDLVVRRAFVHPEAWTFGITAYVTACGSDAPAAPDRMGRALTAFADALCTAPAASANASPLQ